jgi:hypothetical protein
LRDLTLERLGQVDYAFILNRYLGPGAAAEVAEDVEGGQVFDKCVPILSLRGTATDSSSERRASDVNLLGVQEDFLGFFEDTTQDWRLWAEGLDSDFAPVVINQALQYELQVGVGDSFLVSFSRKNSVNPEFLFGGRESSDLLGTLRVQVAEIVGDSGVGRFSLEPNQRIPHNVFLPRRALQEALGRGGIVNTFLMSRGESLKGEPELAFQKALKGRLRLEDYGLRLSGWGSEIVLESMEMILSPPMEAELREVFEVLEIDARPVLTYLANSIRSEKGTVPYSTVSALDIATQGAGEQLVLTTGDPVSAQGKAGILLDQWTADELDVEEGDPVTLEYFVADWQEELVTQTSSFRVAGVVQMKGLAVDDTLTPRIPGVHEAENIATWDPPIPIDLSQIRPEDEGYWDRFGAAPKAFVPYAEGALIWGSRFGRLTSFRIFRGGRSIEDVGVALLGQLEPKGTGRFVPVRERGLGSASGATDFGMLFIGFSLFLITSAVLLVALLFRLGIERRIREMGILLSMGFPLKSVRQRFLKEGALLAVVGSGLGLAGAVAYGWFMIVGLKTLWVAAIGSPFLELHVGAGSLVVGFLISLAVIQGSVFLSLRSLARLSVTSMLSGKTEPPQSAESNRARKVFGTSSIAGACLLVVASLAGVSESSVVFFAAGTCFLTAGLSLSAARWRRVGLAPIRPGGSLVSTRTALRNAARNPGRSLLCTTLVACASFVIVAVGANRSSPGHDIGNKRSGSGGFVLQAESAIPLVRDLNNGDSLFELGFSDPEIEVMDPVSVWGYRLLPGEDVSCRNLYKPGRPRILGVPGGQIERGGFSFQSLALDVGNPWSLLTEELESGVIPAFGDANSVLWILHKALGDDLILLDEKGEEIRLRLVGLLSRSLFQSEILISSENFQKHFPSRSGFSYFLF